MAGLYIHIPFCERKCSYCAFYSFSKPWNNVSEFFKTLEEELQKLPADFEPETLFLGGGTPTALDFQTLKLFFSMLRQFNPREFSCEANPRTMDLQKLALLRKNGVNRLSMGVQSFNVHNLEQLGRLHSPKQAETVFLQARKAGFKNISLDLMFGIPGQTMEMLRADLNRAFDLGPEHISIYNLTFEAGTPFVERGTPPLDEAFERDMYDLIRYQLAVAGFEQYEISNFSKPGFQCAHNLLYWSNGEYIGCGPAAHSHWRGVRRANVANLHDYCTNGPQYEFEETLTPEAKARETIVMGLRRLAGVEVSSKSWEILEERFRALENEGLLKIKGHHVRLSNDALFVSDAIFSELV